MKKLESLLKRSTRNHYDGFLLNVSNSSWKKIHKHARNSVRKSEKMGVTVERSYDLEEFREVFSETRMHTFPKALANYQVLLLAKHNDQTIAGILLEKAWPVIRYKHASSNKKGKAMQANSLLLWKAAELFEKQGYRYIVLGWSSERGIEHFKEEFATEYLLVPQHFWGFMDKSINKNILIIIEDDPLGVRKRWEKKNKEVKK